MIVLALDLMGSDRRIPVCTLITNIAPSPLTAVAKFAFDVCICINLIHFYYKWLDLKLSIISSIISSRGRVATRSPNEHARE